ISGLQRKMTKQGNAWAIATVEDLAGSIECMFFPATYQLVSTQLVEDAVVFVKGRLDKREDVPRLVAMEMQVPDLSAAEGLPVVRIDLRQAQITPRTVRRLKEILRAHPGAAEVRLHVRGATTTTVYRLGPRVGEGPGFWADVKAAMGVGRDGVRRDHAIRVSD
ncbi:DNA polymerase III subunit alpha, partial [Streptomyces sp. p1417]